jgi:hypothetical protein
LTEKQQKILAFLIDLHKECQNELSTIAPLLARHDLQPSIGTVCRETGIIEKANGSKYFTWNPEFQPINELAVQIDEENNRYYKNRNNLEEIKHLVKSNLKPNAHLIDFKLIWPSLGYSKNENAKRTLYKSFTENKDFIILLNNEENSNGNTGVSNGAGVF